MYTTFLASAFRSIRFGLNEAHGRGIALQLNTLLDAGAFKVGPDGTFTVDPREDQGRAWRRSTREIMTLQAAGDTPAPSSCWTRWRWSARRCSGCSTGWPVSRWTSSRGS